MQHDELVFEALAYMRNLGADEKKIRSFVRCKEPKKGGIKNDRASLERLAAEGLAIRVGHKWFLTPSGQRRAKGEAARPGWLIGDSLVLMALLISSRDKGCDLAGILGAADYIDHGIPSLETMHGAINRLVSGGLVKTRRSRFYVTEKAAGLYAKIEGVCGRGVRRRLHGLSRILDCPCCGVPLNKVRWRTVLDEAQMKAALQAYRKEFANS